MLSCKVLIYINNKKIIIEQTIVSYRKLTLIRELYSFYVIDDAITNNNSVVILSTLSIQACNFLQGNIVFVKSKSKDTVLIVLTNDELDCGIARVSPLVQDSLNVRYSDMVFIQSCLII